MELSSHFYGTNFRVKLLCALCYSNTRLAVYLNGQQATRDRASALPNLIRAEIITGDDVSNTPSMAATMSNPMCNNAIRITSFFVRIHSDYTASALIRRVSHKRAKS